VFRGADKLVLGHGSSNRIWIEAKTGYYGSAFGTTAYSAMYDGGPATSTTANGDQSGATTLAVASTTTALAAGDLIITASETITARVVSATATSIVLDTPVTVANGEQIYYFRAFTPVVTFAVEAAGVPGIEKQFRELQLHFGKRQFDNMTVTFSNEHSYSATAMVTVSSAEGFGYFITRPSTIRIEVPAAMKQAALLTVSLSTTEAWAYFDLLGYSVSYEPISERTGK
jgi:hypothetical protein